MEQFKPNEVLAGERITLKKHHESVADTMFKYVDRDRERLGRFLPWVDFIKSAEDELNYIKTTHQKWDEGTLFDYGLFLNDGDTYMGNIGVHSIFWKHHRCELGYWILGDFEGKGYMSDAVRILEKHLFEKGFNRVQIRCSDLNERSERVPLNCGYVYEGTARQDAIEKGGFRNTKTFSKLKAEFFGGPAGSGSVL